MGCVWSSYRDGDCDDESEFEAGYTSAYTPTALSGYTTPYLPDAAQDAQRLCSVGPPMPPPGPPASPTPAPPPPSPTVPPLSDQPGILLFHPDDMYPSYVGSDWHSPTDVGFNTLDGGMVPTNMRSRMDQIGAEGARFTKAYTWRSEAAYS